MAIINFCEAIVDSALGLGLINYHLACSSCSHSFFEFSQTFPSVSVKQLDYELEISIVEIESKINNLIVLVQIS